MAITIVNGYKKRLLDGAIDLANDTIKAMFLTSSHTTDIDAQEYIDDVSTNEVSASGTYSAGGVTLTMTNTQENTLDKGKADAADFSVTGFTGSVRYIVFYKDTGTPSTSPIIGIEDLGANKTATAGTWAYTVATTGLLTTT